MHRNAPCTQKRTATLHRGSRPPLRNRRRSEETEADPLTATVRIGRFVKRRDFRHRDESAGISPIQGHGVCACLCVVCVASATGREHDVRRVTRTGSTTFSDYLRVTLSLKLPVDLQFPERSLPFYFSPGNRGPGREESVSEAGNSDRTRPARYPPRGFCVNLQIILTFAGCLAHSAK